MDVELTMGILKALNGLDRVILVSGDSDYLAPVRLVHSQGEICLNSVFPDDALVGAALFCR